MLRDILLWFVWIPTAVVSGTSMVIFANQDDALAFFTACGLAIASAVALGEWCWHDARRSLR